jgi:putative transposase
VSSLGLHVVWCPKYRRRILGGRVARRCGELLERIVAKEIMRDHVHLFVKVGPVDAPAQVARMFKGRTARVLRQEFRFDLTPKCCGRRRISQPRSVSCWSRRGAATSSTAWDAVMGS